MNLWVVIAAYNEEKKIFEVVSNLKKDSYKNIIVVDDGSKDKTFEQASVSKAKVLRHIINRGQGAALKTGIDFALENKADIIVTFDADGQHRVEDIPKLVQPILNNRVDVTLGSRFLNNDSNVPLIRKVFLKGGALIFRLFYGIKLTDSHNGFRALSRVAAQKINITQDRMEHASEIVEEITKQKLSYVEIPVNIKYTDYSLQHGQKNSNAFKILFKMIFHRLVK